MTATQNKPALPRPSGIKVKVFRDDNNWDKYDKYFMRPLHEIQSLYVTTIILAHYKTEDGYEELAYTNDEWVEKSQRLVDEYPNCIFIY